MIKKNLLRGATIGMMAAMTIAMAGCGNQTTASNTTSATEVQTQATKAMETVPQITEQKTNASGDTVYSMTDGSTVTETDNGYTVETADGETKSMTEDEYSAYTAEQTEEVQTANAQIEQENTVIEAANEEAITEAAAEEVSNDTPAETVVNNTDNTDNNVVADNTADAPASDNTAVETPTEAPTAPAEASTEAPATPTEAPTAAGHWEEQKIVDQAAYDETIQDDPIYHYENREICRGCGADITDWTQDQIDNHMSEHMHKGENGSYYEKQITTVIGYNSHVVHHDEQYHYERVWVTD